MEIVSPRISVVVPAYNSENTISRCLDGLLNQTIPKDQYEIIVVDDASKDNTRAAVQTYPDIRLVTIPHGGPAAGRNAGAKLAAGEILAFTDSDCVPTPDWLRCLTSPFEDPKIVGVKGAYRTLQSEIVARFVQLEYESKYRRMQKRPYIDFIDTYSAAYRKDVLGNNGFDTSFPVASVEDQEFSFRLASKGYRMVFVPSAIVLHQHDRTLREYVHRKFNIGLWKGYMLYWLPEKTFEDSHTLPSQRWQILLLGIGLIFLVLSLFQPWALWISALSLALSLFTAIPFLFFIFQQDPRLLLPSLALLLARSSALGLGLLAGFMYLPLVKPHQKKQGLTMFERFVKRLADILISLIGFILFLPFFPLVALAIKVDSPVQCCFPGALRNGKPFTMLKFRTMVDNAEKIFTLINPESLKTGL
jgi:cellulose synthase/poly-beta-1,6-N-acetylglucosamine synthase-like glycosyltransferase